jgi:hypothetical protein
MTLSSSDFLLRFPEFGEQSLSVVEAALLDAATLVPSTIWGSQQDAATSYLAAHLLATRTMQIGAQVGTPSGAALGEQLRSTHYGQNYLALSQALPLTGFAL